MNVQDNRIQIKRNSRVKMYFVDSSGATEHHEYTLVASEQADLKSGLLDETTPLGQTLMGRFPGETIPYKLGDLQEVVILGVENGDASISPEAARKRRADVRKAAAQSEITNQMIFATASGSKWGDYDVDLDKLLENDENQQKKPGD